MIIGEDLAIRTDDKPGAGSLFGIDLGKPRFPIDHRRDVYGGILGAVIGGPIQKRFRFGQVIITTVWISALVWPLYAIAPNPIFLGVIAAISFTTGPVYNVVQFSYRLSIIPDELQGRVNSVFRLFAFGFQPLGWALTGVLIQVIQVIPTILVLFACLLILAVLTTLNPHVRHARPQPEAQTG